MAPGTEYLNGVSVKRFAVINRFTWLRLNLARVANKLHLPGADWLRGMYFGPIVPGLQRAVRDSNADVVVGSSFPMIHMYAALHGGHRAGKPVVLIGTIHPTDTWSYELPRMYAAIKAADRYVALSTYERNHLVSRGVPASHIEVIGAGVDPQLFEGEALIRAANDMRQKFHWGSAPVVAIVGRQTWYKRADIVLSAMQMVWQHIPDARLVIAGARTNYTAMLREMVSGLPLEKQGFVSFIEDFCDQDKPVLYAACDLLAQPSERESFGIVFLEAWAAGKPVVGARSGAASSLISEGEDGLLAGYAEVAEWAHAIVQLLHNPLQRAEMGRRGKLKVCSKYTWDAVTLAFRDAYLGML